MKILVTGGAGFIASHVVDSYVQAGHSVTVIDDLSVGKQANLNPTAGFYQIDIRNQIELEKLIARLKPEVINHHAAQKFLRRSVEEPVEDAEINIIGSLNLINAAVKTGCRRFIFASTAAVYGDQSDQLPYREATLPLPISPYGTAKLAVEHYLASYYHNQALSSISLRYANVYGPRQDAHGESGVVAIFTEQLLKNQKPKIFGSGQQTRDYIYIKDVVRANLLALESTFQGEVNISTETETSLLSVYKTLNELIGQPIEPAFNPAKKGDPTRLVLAKSEAEKVLAWQPKTSLADGLKQTVDWFRAQGK